MNALYIICGLGVVSLVAEVVNLKKGLLFVMMAGILVAAVLISRDWNTSQSYFSDMLLFDNTAIAFTVLICCVSVLWLWMATPSLIEEKVHATDQIALVLFTLAGAVILTSFNNMAMLFLGIEILSISLYVLAGGKKENLFSNEASFKYFLMGSFATGFLLMGIALIYGATQSFSLTGIASFIESHGNELPGFFYIGVLMMFVGMTFKISAVPFHFWAPDVYEGSPTSITAFMSTIVKVAAFAAFFRVFPVTLGAVSSSWLLPLEVITVLTLIIANVTAVFQNNVKRMLAFSSVGHAGYTLLAIVGGEAKGAPTIFYYLAVYSVASIAAFGVVSIVERAEGNTNIESFNGLFKRNPLLAVAFTIALLSLAGIPPLAGFFGKYLVFALALGNGYSELVLLGVVTSLIGVYYYFKPIIAMFFIDGSTTAVEVSGSQKILIYILILLSIGFGVLPDLLNVL